MPNTKKEFNILVIEDNPGDFALVEEFLLAQIQVVTILHATSFKEAREILTSGVFKFDIILLDLSLPDQRGLPLIRGIVDLCPNTPVIILTGYSDADFALKSLSLGISDYLLKDDLTEVSLYKSIVYSYERKKVVQALKDSEKQYSELFNSSPLPMYVFEVESLAFLDVNAAFLKHYGYTREEFFSMDLTDIRPPEEIPALKAGLSADSKDFKNNSLGIYKHLKKNGEIIQVDIQSNFIQYKGKNAKVTIATDVTERLNYTNAIEAQNKKLSQISWIQSHKVRGPLARILGLIQVFKSLNVSLDEKERMLDYLLTSANELDDVIKEITDITAPEDDNNLTRYIESFCQAIR